jgi:hypothetical protein
MCTRATSDGTEIHHKDGPEGRRSLADVSLIARVIGSLELRRGVIPGLPPDLAVVAYDELCHAVGNALMRADEAFDYDQFLRMTLGIRGGR